MGEKEKDRVRWVSRVKGTLHGLAGIGWPFGIVLILAASDGIASEPSYQVFGQVSGQVFGQASGSPVRLLTLEEAVHTARLHQPQLRKAQADTHAAQAHVKAVQAPLFPQISGRVGLNVHPHPDPDGGTWLENNDPAAVKKRQGLLSLGLQLDQLLYDGGQTWASGRAAQALAQAQQVREQTMLLGVLLKVRTTYFNAQAAKALLGVAQEALENQKRHLVQIQGFVHVGTRPDIDVAQARKDLANVTLQRIQVENDYAAFKSELNQAMGLEMLMDYDVSDQALPPIQGESQDITFLLEEALHARPEFDDMRHQMQAQAHSLRALYGSYIPRLHLFSGVGRVSPSGGALRGGWEVGVGLAWPLFQGGLTQAQTQEAQARLAGLQAAWDTLEQQVRWELTQARLGVRSAQAAIQAASEVVVSASELLRLAEGRYETGVGSILELEDAQLALSSAAAAKVKADYQLASARAHMLYALGRR